MLCTLHNPFSSHGHSHGGVGHGHSHGGGGHGHSHGGEGEGNLNVKAAIVHVIGDLVQVGITKEFSNY